MHIPDSMLNLDTVAGTDDRSKALAELEARVAKMRALGVTKWGDIELGAEPAEVVQAKSDTQQAPDDLEKRRRADHRRVALSASSGLVRRLDHED